MTDAAGHSTRAFASTGMGNLSHSLRRFRGQALIGSVVGLAVYAAAPSAQANGYQTATFGASLGGPQNNNIYSLYFNPAALAGISGTDAALELSLAYRHASYNRSLDALSPSSSSKSDQSYVLSNTGNSSLDNVGAVPFAGVVTDLGTKNLRLGYAIYTPFGGQASWNKNAAWQGREDSPGAYDGAQRWSIIDGTILSVYNTIAASYRVIPSLSVGLSLSVVYNDTDFLNARNPTGSDDTRTGTGSLVEGRARVKADGVTGAGTLGVYFDPKPDHSLRLGLSYISQPGLGELKLRGTFTLQEGTAVSPSTADTIDLRYSLPDIIRAGIAVRPTPKLELRADAEYVRWSVFNKQCVAAAGSSCNVDGNGNVTAGQGGVKVSIPRLWKDVFGARIGGSYDIAKGLSAFLSLGFSTSPVPKETIDAATVDSTRFFGTIGAKIDVSPRVSLLLALTQIVFAEVDTGGIQSQRLAAGLTQFSAKVPSEDGTYKQSITYGNVGVNVHF